MSSMLCQNLAYIYHQGRNAIQGGVSSGPYLLHALSMYAAASTVRIFVPSSDHMNLTHQFQVTAVPQRISAVTKP
jgi:hypothetical protein